MSPRTRSTLRQVLGWTVGLICLAWVLHGMHARQVWAEIGRIQWGWIVLAVILDVLSYGAQGVRWSLLMRPLGRLSYLRSTQAVYIGLFTNEILPLRVGEVVRAFMAGRWLKQPLMSMVPSMAVERFFDGVWLALGIGVTALLVELPPQLMRAAEVLGGVVMLAAIAFFIIVLGKQNDMGTVVRKQAGLQAKLWGLLKDLAGGIRAIGLTREFFISFLVSSLIVIFQILSFWFVMIGYGIRTPNGFYISIWAGTAVLLIEHLGTAIPNAPSNLGTYQFFTVVGLALFGIDRTTAGGFSMVVFVVLTLPLWLFGLLALMQSGLGLNDIRIGIRGNAEKPS